MKNVLVLGANGFIGHHLVNKLLFENNVVGYDRIMPDIHISYPFIKADFTQDENFEKILSSFQIDTVYHLISSTIPCSGTKQIVREIEENIVPTIKLLEAMKNTGTKRIIFSSSGGTVYGESNGKPHLTTEHLLPICSYGIQKVVIEQYMNLYNHLYNMKCFITRISNPYGILALQNRTQGVIPIFLSKLILKQPIILYGETFRDYIHISDVVEALINIGQYEKEKRIFNIGTGISTSLHHLVQLLETVANCKFIEIIDKDIRDCDVYENSLDISDTINELNWRPKIELEEGIRLILNDIIECDSIRNK
jgi:UDP-glucose 4-epimerase